MTVTTIRYIRKPLFVDVVRVTDALFDAIAAWCQGEVQLDDGTGKRYIHVRVHNPKNPRQTKAFVGDWILYTDRGYKVYTNKAFLASFDEAADRTDQVDGQGDGVILGHEEVAPGVTLNQAIAALRSGTSLRQLINPEEELSSEAEEASSDENSPLENAA